jgi:hypothetical protein
MKTKFVTTTIPFDLELYNSDQNKYTVVCNKPDSLNTEDYVKVNDLIHFKRVKRDGLVGEVGGELFTWNISGDSMNGTTLKLQYKSEIREAWVNVYETSNGFRFIDQQQYTSKKNAEKLSSKRTETEDVKFVRSINIYDL